MTLLSTIGTALPSACIGYLICSWTLRGRLVDAEARATRLGMSLASAAGTLKALGQTAAANQIFEALDDGGNEC